MTPDAIKVWLSFLANVVPQVQKRGHTRRRAGDDPMTWVHLVTSGRIHVRIHATVRRTALSPVTGEKCDNCSSSATKYARWTARTICHVAIHATQLGALWMPRAFTQVVASGYSESWPRNLGQNSGQDFWANFAFRACGYSRNFRVAGRRARERSKKDLFER